MSNDQSTYLFLRKFIKLNDRNSIQYLNKIQ